MVADAQHCLVAETTDGTVLVVVKAEQPDQGFFLLSIPAGSMSATDTWHATEGDAKEQAAYEFPTESLGWRDVEGTPADVVRVIRTRPR